MAMINISDLNTERTKKMKLKEEIYSKILEKCHNRIKMSAASNDLGYCFTIYLNIFMVFQFMTMNHV